jgi:hypothetical protein
MTKPARILYMNEDERYLVSEIVCFNYDVLTELMSYCEDVLKERGIEWDEKYGVEFDLSEVQIVYSSKKDKKIDKVCA